jgi:formylglycine-generating enzyme required for sulfatase activity
MRWIPAGEFRMGSEDFYPEERPVHRVAVDGFWMDERPVTAAEFRRFVRETGYVTFCELPLDPVLYPDADSDLLVPGALVFRKTGGPVDVRDFRTWWEYVPGAFWKRPEGPGSTINGRDRHPVVQIAYEDAEAYATWAGKELPTEAEWEYAARGAVDGAVFPWGDDLEPDGAHRMNVWQGTFPSQNTRDDGYLGTAPVDAFPPNGFGLYNMTGNVWEWCADWYDPRYYATSPARDPTGPSAGSHRVMRGGSYLCHASYCNRYRVGARSGNSPDSSVGNLGFRCVSDE